MKKAIILLSILCVVSVTGVIILIFTYNNNQTFNKPNFDENAIEGNPEVSDDLGYQEFEVGENYTIFLCGKVYKNNDKLTVYLTSVKENNVYVKLRIYKDNKLIGETGLIKPNEYIKDVKIKGNVKKNDKIMIKVMSYEKDTYYSMGVITLNTTIM